MLKAIFNSKRLPWYTTAALFLGIAYGLIAPDMALASKWLGDIFMNLINMVVVPMVLFSIISGIAGMKNIQRLASIGGRVIIVFIVVVFIGCLLAWPITELISPGVGLNFTPTEAYDTSGLGEVSMLDFFANIVPSNIIQAMADADFMQVIFFAVVFGIALVLLGEKGEPLANICDLIAQTIYKVLGIVLWYMPIGVFCLIGWTVAEYGQVLFQGLAMFVLTDVTCCLSAFVVLMAITCAYTRINPFKLIKSMVPIILNTVSTNSSAATIPITMNVTTEDLRVPKTIASFSISLGPTICKAGAGLYKVVLPIFVAQMYGIDLGFGQVFTCVLISTFMSIATPGIPGGGVATGAVILGMMGLPLDIMGAIAGLYRLIDMGHTTLNVAGGLFGTLIVAKETKMWDASEAFRPALEGETE